MMIKNDLLFTPFRFLDDAFGQWDCSGDAFRMRATIFFLSFLSDIYRTTKLAGPN